MCAPPVLLAAATAISAAGQAYSGYSAYTEARYKAGVADNNAALSREQAADAIERGERDQQAKWRQIALTKAAQIAGLAASGLDTTFGTAAGIVGDTAVLGSEDVQIIAENASREARGFSLQAQNFNAEAGGQRRAGTQALISTAFNVTSTILGGAQQLQGMKLPTSTASANAVSAPYIRTR